MGKDCPRCHTQNADIARFCARCGLLLEVGLDGTWRAGRIRHPGPGPVPEGYAPCQNAADLYYHSESSLGGKVLLGTEGLNVVVFNSGYPLRDVVLELRGTGKEGQGLFTVERTVEELPQGEKVALEVPSYELSAPLGALTVALVSAEFATEE
jgi:hypothetical protein